MVAVIYILSVKYPDDFHVLLYNLFLVMFIFTQWIFSNKKSPHTPKDREIKTKISSFPDIYLCRYRNDSWEHEKKALGIINSLLEGIGDLDQQMLRSVPDCTKCAVKLGNNWQLCLSLVYSLRAPKIKPSMSVDFLKNRLFFIFINWRLHYHLFICLTLFLYMIKMV